MKIKPLFAWYDLWIGAYWDRSARRLYVLPLPCVGVVFDFGKRDEDGSTLGGSLTDAEIEEFAEAWGLNGQSENAKRLA